MDAELLIKENMGRLTLAARKLSRNFGVPDMMDDLIQEGVAGADGGGGCVREICGDLSVSPAVARKLILEYRETFSTVPLDDADADTGDYGNPEQLYTEKLQRAYALEALNSLSSRSRTIIKYHLGLDQPEEQTMTFKDLAVRLNYNSPGAAEKAHKRAVAEQRRIISAGEYGRWRSSLQAVRRARAEVPQTDCHIPWSEVNDLAEQFVAHFAILQQVYSILSEY